MTLPRWELSPPLSAQENMDSDLDRLTNLKEGDPPLLRFYQWRRPALTYGYFTRPETVLDLQALEKAGYEMGCRPTGGGIIFHTADLAFSVLIPKNDPHLSENTLANYQVINTLVQKAIRGTLGLSATLLVDCQKNSSFCMAQPSIYDVMLAGRKVGGAAQRRSKTGLLHQGSICLQVPDKVALALFLKDPEILKAMEKNSYPLACSKEELIDSLASSFLEAFSVSRFKPPEILSG